MMRYPYDYTFSESNSNPRGFFVFFGGGHICGTLLYETLENNPAFEVTPNEVHEPYSLSQKT